MTKLASNQRARSKRIASHKRTRSSRLHRLQFERFESRVVFDGDGMQAINDVYTTETNTPLRSMLQGSSRMILLEKTTRQHRCNRKFIANLATDRCN